jgi:hypothetical protein
MKKYRMLIDFSYFLRRCFDTYSKMVIENEETEPFSFWKHLVLIKILEYKSILNFSEVILACDKSSWRKKYFSSYKANRSYDGLEDYFEQSNLFIGEIKKYFPDNWKLIQAAGAEGDDVIASLILNKPKDSHIDVIYSSDKDLKQLLLYPDVIYFNMEKEKTELIEDMDQFKENNLIHILRGDQGDNIPNIFTDKKKKGTRSKSVTKDFIEECKNNLVNILNTDTDIKRRFERNKKLILLTKNNIPEEIQLEIDNQYINYKSENRLEEYFDLMDMKVLKGRIKEFL